MDITPLPFRSSLEEYHKQAEQVLEAWKAGDPGAIQIVRRRHPRFLDTKIAPASSSILATSTALFGVFWRYPSTPLAAT